MGDGPVSLRMGEPDDCLRLPRLAAVADRERARRRGAGQRRCARRNGGPRPGVDRGADRGAADGRDVRGDGLACAPQAGGARGAAPRDRPRARLRARRVARAAHADHDRAWSRRADPRRDAGRLLLLAAVEHPGFLHRSRVDVDALVTETERRWRASAPRDWRVETRAGGSVPADGERLSYALDALIENAVKFTSDGGSISIRAGRAGETAVIEVHDDGPGVPAAEAERVFEPFARDGGVRGTGLGLPIVKAIAEAHGGSIALVAGPAGGATFELRLPGFRPAQAGPRPAWILDPA